MPLIPPKPERLRFAPKKVFAITAYVSVIMRK